MVEPTGTGTQLNTIHTQIVASLDELARHLPFMSPSIPELQAALVEAAHKHYHPHRAQEFVGLAMDVQDISTQLLKYVRQLPESASLHAITTREELLDDFICFLMQPLVETQRDVTTLERRVHDQLSRHPTQKLSFGDFSRGLDRALALVEDYARLAEMLTDDVRIMRRRVQVLSVIFVDPGDYILKMRTILHELSNILEVQKSSARGIVEFKDIETTRVKYFKSLCSTFDAKLDPFHRVRAAYPQINISIPRQRLALADPQTLQSILHHLIRNAVEHGAERIALSLLRRNEDYVTVAVMDDGPGIPAEIQATLGKEIIGDSSGWYIMKNELVPQLGDDAEISFISPHRDGHGTLVKITMPINPRYTAPRGPGGKPMLPVTPDPESPRDTQSSDRIATVHDIKNAGMLQQDASPPQSPTVAGALGMAGTRVGVILNFPMIPLRPTPR